MSIVSNLQDKYKTKKYSKQNDNVFADYLKTHLQEDELQKVMNVINHPEIHRPLMKNIDALMSQPNFTPDMQKQFANQIQQMPESKLGNQVLEKLNTSNQDTSSLLSNLNINRPTKKPSLRERLQNKIRETYDVINENMEAAKKKVTIPLIHTRDKVSQSITDKKNKFVQSIIDKKDKVNQSITNIKDSITDQKNKVTDSITPVVDMIIDRAQNRLSDLREEYHVRQLTRTNDRNLTDALKDGVTSDQISEGISSLDYPEIRYGMLHNADGILKQKSMTLDLALDFYDNAQPYIDELPNNDLKVSFMQAFDDYSKLHADELSQAVDGKFDNLADKTSSNVNESIKPEVTVPQDETEATVATKQPITPQEIPSNEKIDELLGSKYKDFKQAHLSKFKKDGASVWDIQTDNGTQSMSDKELTDALQTQYPNEAPFEYANQNDAKAAEQVSAFAAGLDGLEEPPQELEHSDLSMGLNDLNIGMSR